MKMKTPAVASYEGLEKIGNSALIAFPQILYRMHWLTAVHKLTPEAAAIVADHLAGGTYD
jgi:hypothetical protein